jgi:hypothetical protein
MAPWLFGDAGGAHASSDDAGTIAAMLLTILKVVAGLAVLGIISIVLIAVISGLTSSARALRNQGDRDDTSGDG